MASSKEDDLHKDVTSNEEKELRRVYNYLCLFAHKSKIFKDLDPKRARRAKLASFRKNPEAVKIVDEEGVELGAEAIDDEYATLDGEVKELEAQIAELNTRPGRKISADDIHAALQRLGHRLSKKDVQDMIWEVDENLDGCVDWEEFHIMFQRNIKDTSGLEPYKLFNIIQFMMYDRDMSGQVSMDEAMHMLYARYGKDRLEGEMKLLFGDDLKTQDGDGALDFAEYLEAVNVRIPKARGRAAKRGRAGAATGKLK